MTRYSVQPRDQIFAKSNGFLSFAEKSEREALKATSKRFIQKTAEATGDLIGNKIDRTRRVSKTSPQNNSETNEEKMLREKCIPPKLRQKTIDDLRLKEEN